MILQVIRNIEGVEVAFPEEVFSAKIRFMDEEKNVSASSIPHDMIIYPPFDNITYGNFFDHDSSLTVVIRWEMLKRMHIIVAEPDEDIQLSADEKEQGFIIVPPDSIIGKPISLITAVLDPAKLLINTLIKMLRKAGIN